MAPLVISFLCAHRCLGHLRFCSFLSVVGSFIETLKHLFVFPSFLFSALNLPHLFLTLGIFSVFFSPFVQVFFKGFFQFFFKTTEGVSGCHFPLSIGSSYHLFLLMLIFFPFSFTQAMQVSTINKNKFKLPHILPCRDK